MWDPGKEQIFCARDQIGVKQFYHHLSNGLFLFGNSLKSLTQYPDISKAIDDEAVANYLVHSMLLDKHKTFFESFKKLPPAHTLTVTQSTVKQTCYWKLEDSPKQNLPDMDVYAKKLRELLEKSVYARMRSDYPITSHLSGGLDSSSIAVLAARKLKEKGQTLLAFNWLYAPEESDEKENYEWSNSKEIAEEEGIKHHYVPLTAEDISTYMDKCDFSYGETAVFWYEYPVRAATKKHHSRTILSGWGGDELVSYQGWSYYADLFVHGKLSDLFKALKDKTDKKNLKSKLSFIYTNLIVPLTPKFIYCYLPKITCNQTSYPFVKKTFLPMIEKERKRSLRFSIRNQRTIKAQMLSFWKNGHIQGRIESWATIATQEKIDYSYPLLDKRLIEFIVGVPGNFFIKDTVGRYIFRKAIEDLLPEEIAWGNAKSEPNRVRRLAELEFESFKRKTIEEKWDNRHNNYINSKKISNSLLFHNIPNHNKVEEKLLLMKQMERYVLLYTLKNRKSKTMDPQKYL